MSKWVCQECGLEREARCKPRKCPECAKNTEFAKKEEEKPKKEKE